MTPDEIIAAILERRDVEEPERFLNPDYTRDNHDPWWLPDMKPAVDRIKLAAKTGELVAIYGDYDIDGLTATTILLESFAKFGLNAMSFIPDRYQDGYGLSKRGIDELKAEGVSLIVTVDCGSTSLEEVDHANQQGIDVIVTDHHNVLDTLPKAVAVINPKRADNKYPFIHLAGVGVAFKLVQALQEKLEGLPKGQEKWLLDLVALGTVCDVVELTDENRMLVKWGLEVMRRTRRPGLRALAAVSDTPIEEVNSAALGWRFGPRLNAAGRLETAQTSLDLLTATDETRAMELALQLNTFNEARRQTQAQIFAQAMDQAKQFEDHPVLVLSHPDWSHGVVGIVAGNISRELGKPVFLLQESDNETKGSARSFGDFHLAPAIQKLSHHIVKGGGHAFAAGVTLEPGKLDGFREAINEYYRQQLLPSQEHHLRTEADISLDSFMGLDKELLGKLALLEPFGQANQQPVFEVKDIEIASWRPVGSGKNHAKLWLKDRHGASLDAIGFGLADIVAGVGRHCTATFYFEANEFRGVSSLQCRVIELK